MRVLVCGGRHYANRARVYFKLDSLAAERGGIALVIHGAALGADMLAGEWARLTHTPCLAYPAEWLKYGKAAGPKRNQKMLVEGKPDLVVAFPGGKGTADMVRRARRAGVEVVEVSE